MIMMRAYGKSVLGRMTKSGAIILLILVLLLLSAWNTAENLLYIVLGGVCGMFFLSLIAGKWSLHKTALHRSAPYAVFREESFFYTATIENHKRVMPALSLRIEHDKGAAGYIMRIPAGYGASAAIEHAFKKRGAYKLPPCRIATSFPFGFIEQRRTYDDAVEVLVYPRIRPVRISVIERFSGMQFIPSRVQGEGDEYFCLREYVHGDDLRLVAWRISARLGVWMIREMGVSNARIITFMLDTRQVDRPDFEMQFEDMIEAAASLMVALLNRQYSVGFIAPDMHVECAKGPAQERHILDGLAYIAPVQSSAFPDFPQQARKRVNEQSRLLYLSPNPDPKTNRDASNGIDALDQGSIVYA